MPTIGETLKAAREARGLSLPEAGQATRIKTQQLDALERDDYRTIPAAPYARGFIKLYAQFLHLDPAPLLEQYNIRHGKSAPPPAPTPTTPTRPRPPARPATAPAAATPAARAVHAPEPVPAPVAPPPPADPAPAPDAYVPILPVAGVAPPTSAPARPDELPLFDAPVTPASAPVPGPAAVEEESAATATPVVSAPTEPAAPVFPAVPAPAPAVESSALPPVEDAPPSFAAPDQLPVESVQRDAEGAVEVVERFAPPSASDDRIEAARRADRQMRLRQAVLVMAAVLVFVGVLWLIRKLVRDAAPDASELSGINARARGLVAPPPEPYLEGR